MNQTGTRWVATRIAAILRDGVSPEECAAQIMAVDEQAASIYRDAMARGAWDHPIFGGKNENA